MDISKFCIPTLDGPNWGQWLDCIQSTARILDIWDVMRGEILMPAPNLTRDLLAKPSQPAANATAAETAAYTTIIFGERRMLKVWVSYRQQCQV